MCNAWCLEVVKESLRFWPQAPARVLEVGARNINGSPRDVVPAERCAGYLGIDIVAGPGVDLVADVMDLPPEHRAAYDVVLCTEVLEHVRDWAGLLCRTMLLLQPEGLLVLTTRSPGFEYHPWPEDHWRFTPDTMRAAFANPGMEILHLSEDPDLRQGRPSGVGICVQRHTSLQPLLQRWCLDLRTAVKAYNVHTASWVTLKEVTGD